MSLLFNFVELAALALTFIFFCFSADIFFQHSTHFRLYYLIAIGGLEICLGCIPHTYLSNTAFSIIAMVISLVVLLLFYQGSVWQKILLLLLFNLTDILLTTFVTNLFLLSGAYTQETLYTSGSYIRVLYIFVNYTIEFMILYYLQRLFSHKAHENHPGLGISVLFFLSDFIVAFLVHIILVYFAPSHTALNWICLLISFSILPTTVIGLHLLTLQSKEQENHLENTLLKMQITEQEKQFHEIEKKYDLIRITKHDIKRLLLNYRILLEEGKTQDVLMNINELLNSVPESTEISYTDNKMLDAVLHTKLSICQENFIVLHMQVALDPRYQNMDYMIAVSNLLDNAIEAEQMEDSKNRCIRFEVTENEHIISTVIQNYITDSILDKNPQLQTTKSGSAEHGLGLKSVRMIVSKHNGMIDIYEKDHMFCVHTIFPRAISH